ncbi:hypothetical protein BG005_003290 [Podila minutissima]|nr:hypothetical protein BG005_003290 [Podila minutissima]
MLDTYPRLKAPAIRRKVTEITNCVPGELVYLSANVKDLDRISMDDLQKWTESRTRDFLLTAEKYYVSRSQIRKERFYKALQQMLLSSTSKGDFAWDFIDLGLSCSRPFHYRRICDGSHSGADFETALCHQLICTTKPIVFNATDLNGKNPTTISLDFSHCDTLQIGKISLGSGHENVLTHGYEGYPRFDLMLGPLFTQASISDFGQHNKKDSADICESD